LSVEKSVNSIIKKEKKTHQSKHQLQAKTKHHSQRGEVPELARYL
jgi:hypothetical protein